ncbi:MAG: hypothetical protein WCF85_00805 [Rhodospirillaceae bacterium]
MDTNFRPGIAVTRVYIDPMISDKFIIRSVILQIGFAIVDDFSSADICVTFSPGQGKLFLCPGTEFAVNGTVATFDAGLVSSLNHYQRGAGQIEYSGHYFTIRADHGNKSEILHFCAKTLFELLLSNDCEARFLWWYPNAKRGVMNYRVDVDDNAEGSYKLIAKKLDRHMAWCSIYFTTSCFASDFDSIRRSHDAGAEIGSHCHYHYTFERDPATNEKNLKTSIDFLRRLGLNICGAAMPSGKSFPGIGDIMASNNINYTSNFGLIFDSLPIELNDGKATHLEVPIHPVSPGNILKSTSSLSGINEYLYSYYMKTAIQLSESFLPIFFYGHDNDNIHISLLPILLDRLAISFPDHAFIRLDQYATFWRERLNRLTERHNPHDGENVAVIQPHSPDRINITNRAGDRTWPLALDKLLLSPLNFVGEGALKPRLRDRLADRYELETVLPITALALTSYQGWMSAGYKVVRHALRALLRLPIIQQRAGKVLRS